MNYAQAKEKMLKEGVTITKHSWDLCKTIRAAKESDVDYINYPPEGVIVEDCENRQCDCKIAIYTPTEADQQAEDFIIAV